MSSQTMMSQKTGTLLDQLDMAPAAKFLGFQFLDFDPAAEILRVQFTASEAMLNPRGTVQGGFLTAMLDEVMGSLLLIVSKKGPLSVDLHTRYFAPAYPGPLIGEARISHRGKSTGFTEGTLFNADGQKVASATQTQRLFTVSKIDFGDR